MLLVHNIAIRENRGPGLPMQGFSIKTTNLQSVSVIYARISLHLCRFYDYETK